MPAWRELYSRGLEVAMALYIQGDMTHLERQLNILEGIMHDDDALRELKEFTEQVEGSYQAQIQAIDIDASKKTNPIGRGETYSGCDRALDWRLYQLLRHHQFLAKKYSLFPSSV